ncbi:MAG: helix-turn-helix domain-containing protein [Eubacteriales bacterium]|nr:helix-turn-helix domain-containing protein [Eubacteriales bacterium]
MHLDSKLKNSVLDAAATLKADVYLLDETGTVLVSRDEARVGTVDLALESVTFERGAGESEDGTACYFAVQSDNYKPVYLALPGTLEQMNGYGHFICELLREILKTAVKRPGREEIYRSLLLDRFEPFELQEAIRDFKLDPDNRNIVILIQTFESDAMSLYDTLLKIFPRSMADVVAPINRYVIALVKSLDNNEDIDSVIQLVNALDDTLANELSVGAYVGVGSVKRGLINIKDSFYEAQEAINLGIMQQTKGRVFLFQRLLLERFLQEIPRELRRQYYELAYTESMKKLMTDEILETMTKFFENNLNLSEAARKLYIHRNTLIYRLEKIQKVTGLDLRNFDDAVLLKIIIMLGKSLSSTNRME